MTVHRAPGPGLLDSVYEPALAHELEQRGLSVERQVPIQKDISRRDAKAQRKREK
ncbi:MAG: GxxExxY protein [Thiohalocapsa sp.]|nr:GxxExxY protein [Thiohalocapsa sp.]